MSAATPVLAAEFQVRWTDLDSLPGEQMATDPVADIGDAHVECSRVLTWQESRGLQPDACIWWRHDGGGWELREQPVIRPCEMAGCPRYDATAMSACGTVYLCPACRAAVEGLTAMYAEDDQAEAARLAEKAGAAHA